MGEIYNGLPDWAIDLAKDFNLNIFIETGTGNGNTVRKVSPYFEIVHTIEIDKDRAKRNRQDLSRFSNVTVHTGSSVDILPGILGTILEPAMFWLDAHWSNDGIPRPEIECPLLQELDILKMYNQSGYILIDDARLFQKLPEPHRNWPNLNDIKKLLPDMTIIDDVIVSKL